MLTTTRLAIDVRVDGKVDTTSGPAAFAGPRDSKQGAWPNLAVPRRIAAVSLYRDLHAFYAAKDELFPERTSGLIFFENMMGIFFTGRDLTEEVLAETESRGPRRRGRAAVRPDGRHARRPVPRVRRGLPAAQPREVRAKWPKRRGRRPSA